MKHYSLRLTDDDYDYFCAIAKAESLSLSASIRRHMHNGGMKLGLRVHHTQQGASNTSVISISAPKSRLPVAAATLDSVFSVDGENERSDFELNVEPPDDML